MTLIHGIGVAGLGLAAVAAAWLDLHRRVVPNWLCGATALGGLAYSYAASGPAAAGFALLHAVLALLVGMVLFALRLVGGGDAKFYAAVATWFSLAQGFTLLLLVALSGGVLAVLSWAPLRRRRRERDRIGSREAEAFLMVPYAVAIGVGGVIALLLAG
ncbi:MAG: prepilin peptidase [Sphingomonadales bacterium]|nr:prepilin peptidase [Sphingomonadales bacterium]